MDETGNAYYKERKIDAYESGGMQEDDEISFQTWNDEHPASWSRHPTGTSRLEYLGRNCFNFRHTYSLVISFKQLKDKNF